jgi:hypothetical protein
MTSLEIANGALALIGMPAITSFDPTNNTGKLCKDLFPVCRDRVLRDHSWSFAVKFAKISKLAEPAPDKRFSSVFMVPGDCIRILKCGTAFRKAGRKILASGDLLDIEYIARIEDTSLFDVSFIQALQYLMAAEIGMVNTRDPQLITMYKNEYREALAVARSLDSMENSYVYQTQRKTSNWIRARRG